MPHARLAFVLAALSSTVALPCQVLTGPAVTPQPRIEQWWFARHAEHIGQLKDGEFDVLLVGEGFLVHFDVAVLWSPCGSAFDKMLPQRLERDRLGRV